MVKIKAICRDSNDYKRRTNTEIEKVYRNTNPKLHPFQKAREYIRALNAVKLEKIFSKPFLYSLSQPTDCIKVMSKNTKNLGEFASGGFDGQLIIWELPKRKPIFNIKTSHNMIKGLSYSNNAEDILTCGDDNVINFFNKANLYAQKEAFQTLHATSILENTPDVFPREYRPISSYNVEGFLENIDHSFNEKLFATSGDCISIWNYERNTPLHKFKSSPDGYL